MIELAKKKAVVRLQNYKEKFLPEKEKYWCGNRETCSTDNLCKNTSQVNNNQISILNNYNKANTLSMIRLYGYVTIQFSALRLWGLASRDLELPPDY